MRKAGFWLEVSVYLYDMIWFCFFSDCSTIGATINPEPSDLCLRVFLNYFGKPSSWLDLGHLTSKRINSQKPLYVKVTEGSGKRQNTDGLNPSWNMNGKCWITKEAQVDFFEGKKRRSLVIYLCTRKSSEFSWQFLQSLRWRFRIWSCTKSCFDSEQCLTIPGWRVTTFKFGKNIFEFCLQF